MSYERFEELIREAMQSPVEGWDFSVVNDRFTENATSWDYRRLVEPRFNEAATALDMGTGGGEFLATLLSAAAKVVATEGYVPNVPVARARLEPLGVQAVQVDDVDEYDLPFPDASFGVVLNRHESFSPTEVRRVLRPGGHSTMSSVITGVCWRNSTSKRR